jgi:CheY-like chemotaxis protein
MADQSTGEFNRTAIALSRNPLGIIALFIVLVYAFAALTISIPNQIDGTDRSIIVLFLALFPPVVLVAFVYLVAKYPRHLYGPGDFNDPNDWIGMIQKIEAATNLAAASAVEPLVEGEAKESPSAIANQSLRAVRKASERSWAKHPTTPKRILWVDDHPENNEALRRTFKTFNIEVTPALSTEQALQMLRTESFDAIISDMGRTGDKDAGHTLLTALREGGNRLPFFIYSRRASAAQLARTRELGGNGFTNKPAVLFDQVAEVLGS